VLGGVALLAFLAFLLFFGKKRGWFKKKQSAPEGTAFLDSNPVFEMGGSEFPVKKAGYSDQPSAGGYGNVNGNYGVGGEDGRGNKRLSELP
jgi:hypothetical protein